MHLDVSTLEKDLSRLEILKMVVVVKEFDFVDAIKCVTKSFKELDDQLLMFLLLLPFFCVLLYLTVEHLFIFFLTILFGCILKNKSVVFDAYSDFCAIHKISSGDQLK